MKKSECFGAVKQGFRTEVGPHIHVGSAANISGHLVINSRKKMCGEIKEGTLLKL